MGFIELSKRLNALYAGEFVDIMQRVIAKHYKELTDLNKKQLEKGQKSDGTFLKAYAPSTVRVRQAEGNPVKGDLIALFDTGDFWRGFWAFAYENKLEFLSSDPKTNELIATYGESIFGLTQSNFEVFFEKVMPDIKKEVLTFLDQK